MLSLREMYALFLLGEEYLLIVDSYITSGEVTVTANLLELLPPDEQGAFYNYIGRLAKRLAVVGTLEQDLRPLLACFPHLEELSLRQVLIVHGEIEGYPVKLHKLSINQCQADYDFLSKWAAALLPTLKTLELHTAARRFEEAFQEDGEVNVIKLPLPGETDGDASQPPPKKRRVEEEISRSPDLPPAPLLDDLPEDCLLEIIRHLSTAEFIALSHVNHQLRGIILEYIYPSTTAIEFRVDRKRSFAVKKSQLIQETKGLRERRLCVDGQLSWEVFCHFDYPRLKSLAISSLRSSDYKCIAEAERAEENFQSLLNRVAPTLEELWLVHSSPAIELPKMQNLRIIKADLATGSVKRILQDNPKLQELNVTVWYTGEETAETINELVAAFECTPLLTILNICFHEFLLPMPPGLRPLKAPVLPHLKDLSLDDCVEGFVKHFLSNISSDELKKLSLFELLDEVERFGGLECLWVDDMNDFSAILRTLDIFPDLKVLDTEDTISIGDGMILIDYLELNDRQLTLNGSEYLLSSIVT